MIEFNYNDGGRQEAGFSGTTGDCVTRAITIASGLPYQEVYDELFERARIHEDKAFRRKARKALKAGRVISKPKSKASPRNGVHKKVYDRYLKELGFRWVACMKIGSGCKVHLKKDELPGGTIIVRLSRHLACVIDGVLQDTYEDSRNGTRCVYGYYVKEDQPVRTSEVLGSFRKGISL